MKGSSRMVSAAILSILFLALVVSPTQSRIVKDNPQSGGNEATLGRVPNNGPPSPQANRNRPDLPFLPKGKHN